jgi:hypothetical protein
MSKITVREDQDGSRSAYSADGTTLLVRVFPSGSVWRSRNAPIELIEEGKKMLGLPPLAGLSIREVDAQFAQEREKHRATLRNILKEVDEVLETSQRLPKSAVLRLKGIQLFISTLIN